MAGLTAPLPDDTYVELVRSLFTTLLPTSIMASSFLAVGTLALSHDFSVGLAALVLLGGIAAAGRVGVLIVHRAEAADRGLSAKRARQLERRFAAFYLGFASLFGAFSATAFLTAGPELQVVTVGLLFGYGAGVAAGLSLRPSISAPSIVIATVPTIVAALLLPTDTHVATALLLAVFMAGGLQSMKARYLSTTSEITMRRSFSMLARRDHLTGLANRLSLRERFEAFAHTTGGESIIAVHCLDLDRFKPVNDRFGHPVGDSLLKMVADRLLAALRDDDFAARIGGDEFVIVQTQAKHLDQVEMLARRIAREIAKPYTIGTHEIQIGTSIGYALAAKSGTDIDCLVACADEALCHVKRRGGGIAMYDPLAGECLTEEPAAAPVLHRVVAAARSARR